MPSEYEDLVTALQATDIPFAEYGWKTRPEGTYGVVGLDMESDAFAGDDSKADRAFEASVDLFFSGLGDRQTLIATVEGVLNEVCGSAWELNSSSYERETGLFHMEWVCQVQDTNEVD